MFFSIQKLLNIYKKKVILINRKVLSNLRQKIQPNSKDKIRKNKKKEHKKIKGQKIRVRDQKMSNVDKKKIFSWKDKLTRKNIVYFILFLFDIILVIYMARKNVVHYVRIADQNLFISQTKYLLFGRKYITLIVTAFFYIYICLVHRFFLQEKNTKKFLICLLVVLLILNCFLFCLFTKRIY